MSDVPSGSPRAQQLPSQPPPAAPAAATTPEASGVSGMFQDPSTLAATGLIVAVLLALLAGLLNVVTDMGTNDLHVRLTALTDTVDIGDVALLGIAVALLLVTPDPPGGVPRSLLMQAAAVLAGVITLFGLVRVVVTLTDPHMADVLTRVASALATFGVTIAAFTIAYWAAKESFIKEKAQEGLPA